MDLSKIVDPIAFINLLWPEVYLYQQQREICYSVQHNDETIVPAGNMLGKDFVSGLIILHYFMTRHPCRIVTTSAKDDHLRVLWGEIGNFIQSSAVPLTTDKGGPLTLNHQNLKKIVNGEECKISYVTGMVASPGSIAAMQGHHVAKTGDGIPRTLFVSDESSSVPDEYYTMARTWANRTLVIGNTWPCNNFFYHAIKGKPGTDDKGGDIPKPDTDVYYRKVIKITARDSPNVKYALAEQRAGIKPSGKMLVKGVKDWDEYSKNLVMWDKIQQCVSLEAEFYEGAEIRLYPIEWILRANRIAVETKPRTKGRAIGCDPAEGGDKTCWSVIDDYGLLELVSMKTPDTSIIPNQTIALMKKWDVPPHMVFFDRGGGGKQHADAMRSNHNLKVKTVAFGESVMPEKRRGIGTLDTRKEADEQRYTYTNRRAEMYGMLRLLMDPTEGESFGIGAEHVDLIEQLKPIPLLYDGEGRLFLPPKNKKDPESKIKTLTELIGRSPDEADSLVLAVYGMRRKSTTSTIGVLSLS